MATARSERRGFLDRTLGLVRPRVVDDFTPPPRALSDGLWVLQRKVRVPGGIAIPTHMTVLRLASGGLLVHSPFKLDPAMRRDLDGLGPVAHLVAPSSFHYLFVAEHHEAYPAAQVHLAPALRERRPSLPAGSVLGDRPPAAWAAELDQAVLGPTRGVSEVVFLHRASATLILTDLAMNFWTAANLRERLYWKSSGVWRRLGPTGLVRRVLLRDPALVRPFLARVAAWDFDRIVVAHGDVVERNGRELFRAAFAPHRGAC